MNKKEAPKKVVAKVEAKKETQEKPKKEIMKPDYRARVEAEKSELDEKLEKLIAFFSTEDFPALPLEENQRLQRQAEVMKEYSDILANRLWAYEQEKEQEKNV